MSTYLVVADRAAWNMGLARKLAPVGDLEPGAEFVVVVPADPSLPMDEPEARLVAQEAAARARITLRQYGLTVVSAAAGPAIPRKALEEELARNGQTYDGIIVGVSRRNPALQVQPELAQQLERRHGIPVRLINLKSAVMG